MYIYITRFFARALFDRVGGFLEADPSAEGFPLFSFFFFFSPLFCTTVMVFALFDGVSGFLFFSFGVSPIFFPDP